MRDVEAARMRQHDPVAAVGDDRTIRRVDLDRRGLSDRAGLIAQPLPEHGPVFPVVRRWDPKGGPVIERRMELGDGHWPRMVLRGSEGEFRGASVTKSLTSAHQMHTAGVEWHSPER